MGSTSSAGEAKPRRESFVFEWCDILRINEFVNDFGNRILPQQAPIARDGAHEAPYRQHLNMVLHFVCELSVSNFGRSTFDKLVPACAGMKICWRFI